MTCEELRLDVLVLRLLCHMYWRSSTAIVLIDVSWFVTVTGRELMLFPTEEIRFFVTALRTALTSQARAKAAPLVKITLDGINYAENRRAHFVE